MKHFLQIVPRFLLRQSKRSLLAVTGLILAVALLTSTGILGSSMAASYTEYVKGANGAFHGTFSDISAEQARMLQQHIHTEKVGRIRNLGVARFPNQGLSITAAAYDEAALSLANIEIIKGRMPRDGNEIALENWVLRELGIEPAVGQVIFFEFLLPSGIVIDDEFTLSGILKDNTLSQVTAYSRAVVSEAAFTGVTPGKTDTYSVLVQIKEGLPPRQALEEIGRMFDVSPTYNESLLQAMTGSAEKMPFLLLGVVVLAVTAAAIHNIFHITVLERIRQYGLLRSLGAGPRQLRTVVFTEAFVLFLVAVPFGLALGVLGAHVLVYTASYLQDTVTTVVVPSWVITYAIVTSFITIMVSAYKPARLAARFDPLDALRGTASTLPEQGKPRKAWHKLIERMYGISGQVACRNLERHEKQFKATVFSMAVCIVLILVFSVFLSGADPSRLLQNQYPGEFMLSTGSINHAVGFTEDDIEAIARMNGVNAVYTTQERGAIVSFPADKLTPEFVDYMENRLKQDRAKFISGGEYSSSAGVYSFSENILELAEPYVTAGEINPGKMRDEEQVIIVNSYRAGDPSAAASTLQPGDTIKLSLASFEGGNVHRGEEKTFTIAGVLSGYPFPMEMVTIGVGVIVHPEVLEAWAGKVLYRRLDIKTDEEVDTETLSTALESYAARYPAGKLRSYEQQIEEMETQKRQFAILFFSLIAVIVSISVLSIVNTISTNLLLRTREFGVYRAVGLSEKQLKSMIRVEGLCYGFVSAFWGIVAGNVLGVLLFYIGKQQMDYLEWTFPWQATLLVASGSILLALLATTAPVRRIASMNVTEAIRSIQ